MKIDSDAELNIDELEASLRSDAGAGDDNEPSPEPAPNIPSKLQGKSMEEIIEMYQNLETRAGRQANEIGHLRKLSNEVLDRVMQSSPSPAGTPEEKQLQIDPSEFLDRPGEVLGRVLNQERQTILSKAEERINAIEQRLAEATFTAAHPDWQQTANDPAFIEWVNESALRQRSGQAFLQGDLNEGAALLADYKAQTRSKPAERSKSNAALQEAKKVGLETPSRSAGAVQSKPISREALRNLRRTNRQRYNEMLAEIRQAYAEGRAQ